MRITLFILNHRYVPFQLHHLSIMASHHFPDYPIPSLYQEFYAAYGEDKRNAWRDYFTFGGMPLVLAQKTSEDKSRYLHSLFDKIYLDDIMFRHNIVNEKIVLDDLLDIVSSSVGSLTNPSKIQKTFVPSAGIWTTLCIEKQQTRSHDKNGSAV